jgi:hypothetical protein
MRQVVTSIAFVGLLAVAAGTALSQPVTGPGPFTHSPGAGLVVYGWKHADPAGYLDRLKAALGITPAQEPAWNEYADTVKGVAWQMQGVHQMMNGVIDTATSQERRDMVDRMFQARQRASDLVHSAAEALLPALDAAQRNAAADRLPGVAGSADAMLDRMGSSPQMP